MHIFGYQTDKLSSYLSKLKSMLTTKDTLPTQLYYLYYAISKNFVCRKKMLTFYCKPYLVLYQILIYILFTITDYHGQNFRS